MGTNDVPTLPGFHIYVRPPVIKPITQNLLADDGVSDQTQTVATDELQAAAQALLAEVQPHLGFEQGEISMFVMDVPNVPPEYAPIVIAQTAQTRQPNSTLDRTVGVCQMIGNPAVPPETAQNVLAPLGALTNYFRNEENRTLEMMGKISILTNPVHGKLVEFGGGTVYRYVAEAGYLGQDQATFLVEMGGLKVKLVYFLQIVPGPPDNEIEDKVCPRYEWKVSFDDSDPTAPVYTFTSPTQLTSALAGAVQANLTFANLAGDAVGQTVGNTITLDVNAAGHGWFLDSTPWDNSEFVATSNPNEWVALPGSEAAGKMDLLTVLLHEYGHCLRTRWLR